MRRFRHSLPAGQATRCSLRIYAARALDTGLTLRAYPNLGDLCSSTLSSWASADQREEEVIKRCVVLSKQDRLATVLAELGDVGFLVVDKQRAG